MVLLKVENLKMYFATLRGYVRAVDNVSFALEKGKTLGLAGESGCGKSSIAITILKILPRNGKILDGKIIFENKDIVQISEEEMRKEYRWKKISMVFQGAMNSLHPTITIGEQIAEAVTLHEGIEKKEALERAGKLLDLVGIGASRIDRYPHELSGGMKQRTVIAMALACNPSFVIADEPTTALDVIVEAQVLKVMKELQKKLSLSMMIISHDLSMIAETCDDIAIMYAGKIMEIGNLINVFKETLHPYTQKLIAAFPSVIGDKKELASIHGFPPDLLNPPSGCRFHTRCPYVMEICKKEEPRLVDASKDHKVACHLVIKR